MKTAVAVKKVNKSYGEIIANNKVSLEASSEEIFGLIGPDGAGKTTLIRSICTLLVPDSGEITVLGHNTKSDILEIRKKIGYMPQKFSLYQDLSVEQNLNFFADLFKVPPKERKQKVNELYEFSKLGQFKDRLAGALSGGMKQKLALSCNLVHTPEILILDEPTFGVDPVSRLDFWNMLKEIKRDGIPIFVSTAYMDEAEQCDRIALIHKGDIIAIDTPAKIVDNFGYHLFEITGSLREISSYFQNLPDTHSIQLFGQTLHVSFLKRPLKEEINNWYEKLGDKLKNVKEIKPGVEDIFLDKMSE